MQLDRPRFRQDLVAEPIDDAGTRFIDVMDPDSGNVFRFFEVEYSLACAMDGERDVNHIVQWAREELGLAPSANEVRSVIATLGELGYLDGGAATARPGDDEFMRPGVVVGQKRAHTPAPELELGHAGASAPVTHKPMPASNIEVAPGVTAGRAPARDVAKPAHDDISLGVPGRRGDVSTDLSDSVGIGVEDVKAAVRESKVMKAVDVPPELAASVPASASSSSPAMPAAGAKPVPRPRNTPPPMPVVKPPPEAKPVVAAPPIAAPLAAPTAPIAKVAEPKPVAAIAKPVVATAIDPKKVPTAPQPQTSRTLLVLLVVVVIAAIGFLVYRFVVRSSQTSEATATKPPVAMKPPEPPPPPPIESHKLGTSPESTERLKPVATATIEWIAPDGDVKAGTTIVMFTGAKPLDTEVKSMARDIDTRVKVDLDQAKKDQDAATVSGNKAALATATARVADRQKALDDKQGKLAARQAELDKLEIKAPGDGKVAGKAKVGARVTPTDTVVELTHPAVRTTKFAKADGAMMGGRAWLVAKPDGKKISCKVTAADPGAIEFECPADAVAEGTEVTYGGVDSSPPPAIEVTDPKGSAAAITSPAPVRPPTPKATPKVTPKATPPPPAGSATEPDPSTLPGSAG